MKRTVPAVGFVLVLLGAASVYAHHSPSAIFDMSKHVSVTLAYVDLGNIVIADDQRGVYLSLQAGF